MPGHYNQARIDALPPVVGLCGYARCGKDTAAAALTALGYARHSFGDTIKEAALAAGDEDLGKTLDWVCANEPDHTPLLLARIADGHYAVRKGGVSPFTEDDALKARIRPWLERLGEAFYDDLLGRYLDALPPRAVNCRVVRVKEAVALKERGGRLVLVTRPRNGAASQWEHDRLEELLRADLIDHIVFNDGSPTRLKCELLAALEGK